MVKVAYILILSLAIVGCATTPTPSPTPISFPSIGTTPELEALVVAWVERYRAEIHDDIIQIKTFSPQVIHSSVESGESDLLITGLAPLERWFATPLSHQAVVVIVNQDNEVQNLTPTDLQALFSGRIVNWEELTGVSTPVQPIVPLNGDTTRVTFELGFMSDTSFAPSALLAPTPLILRDLIEEYEGSIGFIFENYIGEDAKVIRVEKLSSASTINPLDDNPLVVEILATSINEPQGVLRDFLVWLQGQHEQ